MSFKILRHIFISSILFGFSQTAFAQTEIQFWHAMGGELGDKVNKMVEGFNASQKEYKVIPVYKGNYAETMTGAIAAFRAKQQPHIVQVFEVGTATMMAAKGAIYPVYKLMQDTQESFDPKSYLSPVSGYYSDKDGHLLSLPFNSSTPVFYYNKDAFRKAGLNPDQPPKTWSEVGEYAKKIQAAGYPCGFTVGWPSWTQLENFSAWHNLPIATNANGYAGLNTELLLNKPAQIKHIAQLAEWQKSKIFDYGGRGDDSTPKFYSGECAMFMTTSGRYGGVKKNAKFDFGVGMMPYWSDITKTPQNSIIGGATLWVLNGHKPEEYKGVAKFFTYLSSPTVQADWHQFTGYLPITKAAYELTDQQGFYKKNPGTDIAIKEITNKEPTENSKGLRMGNFVQVREVIEEELEAVWSGKKTAKQGLDDAVKRSNELLRQFQSANAE
ncbi:MAG: sn-glycerol-3-phosphate ABC transporter substrate-binding protein UgpB [Alphaproteobacteria bacterium]|nr:sn-glycerol-3-phosphate ABC transporter substrate-binding protein UgpB [Alphaproteobacteria bacterium]